MVAKRHVTGPRDRTLQAALAERLAVTGRVTWYSIIRRHDNPGSNAVDSAVAVSPRSWREEAASASTRNRSFSFSFCSLLTVSKAPVWSQLVHTGSWVQGPSEYAKAKQVIHADDGGSGFDTLAARELKIKKIKVFFMNVPYTKSEVQPAVK